MKRITIFFALVGGLVAEFLIASIKAFKNLIKLFSAMTIIFIIFLSSSLFLMYICCHTATVQEDELSTAHVDEMGELMGFEYEEVA